MERRKEVMGVDMEITLDDLQTLLHLKGLIERLKATIEQPPLT